MATGEEATHLVAGEAMVVTGLEGKMTASSVVALDIGPEIVLRLEVAEVGLEVHFHHAPDLEGVVAVATTLEEVVTDTLMIAMMEDAMEIGIAMTARIANMRAVIGMLVTGTHLLEIALQVIGMVVQIVTL